jgi:hypothetical protein
MKGLHFERVAMTALRKIKMDVTCTKQTRDGGIDFQGKWCLPDQTPIIIGQCKGSDSKVKVNQIRELEGVISALGENNIIACFASNTDLSPPSRDRIVSSKFPMLFVQIGENGDFETLFMNLSMQKTIPSLIVSRIRGKCNSFVLFYNGSIISQN